MTVLDQLQEATARGVKVVVITNDYPAPALTLRWVFKEYWWGATGKFRAAGYDLYVIDKDGDASEWTLTRDKTVLAEGGTHECDPLYHFDACLLAAEAAFREVVMAHLEKLRRAKGR
jgi:hypothetical protein